MKLAKTFLRNKKQVLLVVASIVLVLIAGFMLFMRLNSSTNTDESSKTADSSAAGSASNGVQLTLPRQDDPSALASSDGTTSGGTNHKPYLNFGDGVWQVGVDIKPGVYKTNGPSDTNCYYARLSGYDTSSDIISNNNTGGPATVEIAATDKAFQSDGCNNWVLQH